jgi:hypothetical protein
MIACGHQLILGLLDFWRIDMALPDTFFKPDESPPRVVHAEDIPTPQAPGVALPPDVIPAELTADGKVKAHQHVEVRRHEKCTPVRGSETEVLRMADGCIVYKLNFNCVTVSETWWMRSPPTLILTGVINPDNPKKVSKLRMYCPDGSVSGLPPGGGIPSPIDPRPGTGDAPKPSVWIPPEIQLGKVQQATHERRADGTYEIYRRNADRIKTPPPAVIVGCYVTATYEEGEVIVENKLPDGPERSGPFKPFDPARPLVQKTFRIPGCVDQASDHSQQPQAPDDPKRQR